MSLCYHSSTWANICTEVGGGGGGMKASRDENEENYWFFFFCFLVFSSQALFLLLALCREKTQSPIKQLMENGDFF